MRKSKKIKGWDKEIRPLIHEELPADVIDRIKQVYSVIKDVMVQDGNKIILEQFEIMFMREKEPLEHVKYFEKIIRAYELAKKNMVGNKDYTKTMNPMIFNGFINITQPDCPQDGFYQALKKIWESCE